MNNTKIGVMFLLTIAALFLNIYVGVLSLCSNYIVLGITALSSILVMWEWRQCGDGFLTREIIQQAKRDFFIRIKLITRRVFFINIALAIIVPIIVYVVPPNTDSMIPQSEEVLERIDIVKKQLMSKLKIAINDIIYNYEKISDPKEMASFMQRLTQGGKKDIPFLLLVLYSTTNERLEKDIVLAIEEITGLALIDNPGSRFDKQQKEEIIVQVVEWSKANGIDVQIVEEFK